MSNARETTSFTIFFTLGQIMIEITLLSHSLPFMPFQKHKSQSYEICCASRLIEQN